MKAKAITFDAVDALFFRDGRPYRMGSGKGDPGNDQADVTTVFPPSPYTVLGALRAGLAMCHGWSGTRSWDDECKRVLGDGSDLGSLGFRGPFLVRGQERERLYRIPAHYVERHDKDSTRKGALLAPSEAFIMACDIGKVRLPELSTEMKKFSDWKSRSNAYVTFEGLRTILNGSVPAVSTIIEPDELYQDEPRLGLRRDAEKHITGDEGSLYSPTFARMTRGIRLLMEVAGIPDAWAIPNVVPLGGEGRMAILESYEVTPPCDPSAIIEPDGDGVVSFVFVAITPLRLPTSANGALPVRAEPGTGLFEALGFPEIEIVSACVERPQYIGGWDTIGGAPLPVRPHLPAGSVLFCRAKETAFRDLESARQVGVGDDARFGINQFTLGHFPMQ
ncbi:MAG: type III-B CRISPR module-associated Cmr3 family protein [Candidatus Baltobacteraceae bacterium]